MKPSKTIVPLDVALATWRDPSMQYSVKMDGCFATLSIGSSLLACERIWNNFHSFDLLACHGIDVSAQPLTERWAMLLGLRGELTRAGCSIVETSPDGAGLLSRVLAAGGEGVVAKRWSDGYGPMLAAKRVQDFLVHVTGFCGGSQSVTICDSVTGEPRGKVALLGGKVDLVKVGSVLKLRGYGLTERGMIREPRVDTDSADSWLVNF